jgi:hypothetical protein
MVTNTVIPTAAKRSGGTSLRVDVKKGPSTSLGVTEE